MIIAALLVFGALLAAWLLAPAEARVAKRVWRVDDGHQPASTVAEAAVAEAVAEDVARAA